MSIWSTASGDYGLTSIEADPPESSGPHWLTRWDPDDGEPYGTVCNCDISGDHDGDGNLMP